MTGKDAQPLCQGCRSRGGLGPWSPQIFTNQLTLSQQVMANTLLHLRIFRLSYGPVCALQGFIVEGGRPPLTRACKNPFWQGKVKAMAFIGIFYLKVNNVIFSQNMKCSKSGWYNKIIIFIVLEMPSANKQGQLSFLSGTPIGINSCCRLLLNGEFETYRR